VRRITICLTTALTIAAMGHYYNVSRSGDGKDGDGGQPASACAAPETGATRSAAPATSAPTPNDAEDPCVQGAPTGRPGENR
jgi:hypothetical protein